MPPLHILILASLVIITPIYSIAILIFDTKLQPHCRTIRALGSGIIMKSFIIVGLGLIGFLTEGRGAVWMPLLIACMAAIAAYRMMQLESEFHQNC